MKKKKIDLKKLDLKKLKFNIFAKAKAENFEEELPDFKIEKIKTVVELPDKPKNIKYPLIVEFATAEIKVKDGSVEYNIIEPKLTKQEKETYDKVVSGLLEILDVELSSIKKDVAKYLKEKVAHVIEELELEVSDSSYKKIMYYIYRNFVGLNEIEPLLQDPYIEDISCDGVNIPLYIVHRKYGSLKTNIMFKEEELSKFIIKLAEKSGRFISYAEPLLDGSLPDGSRVQATFSKDVTTRGPSFTIRKFRIYPYSPIELIENKTVSSEVMAYLWLAVESGASVLIVGGTGTGKTSFLNSLSMFIHPNAKIVSVEDTREIQLSHQNWLPSVTRPAFTEDYGEVNMFDLLRATFRQSPDYVIVGEVRGKEAYVLFQGMAAGMPSMGTMHAGKVEDVLNRLKSPPINLSPSLLETLDIIVLMIHAKQIGKSARRADEIIEIESVDHKSGIVRSNKVYNWIASEDSYQFKGSSWFLQEISKLKGVDVNALQEEIKLRKKILDWMLKNNIKNYKDFCKNIEEIYTNKDEFLKKANI